MNRMFRLSSTGSVMIFQSEYRFVKLHRNILFRRNDDSFGQNIGCSARIPMSLAPNIGKITTTIFCSHGRSDPVGQNIGCPASISDDPPCNRF